ncbi:major facilitator superfamily domain-containing protein [Syncephalis pseudoplumigaleata]|uniref:Major facilitator superfamily domain-containing protein n=1 Tax=Syncephalis pseudoplumigaleata TaxID=1712513 RepID=A0A4P9Z250_9FUNG|nr:major facilitator superfamily domain-containing protein [Syncephalis pseudoplumigaleata]|eukprot:RKP26418.1 major facilitator superfamily domain-containing protein [Syncephalis pseudoplumigaleata]
MLSRATTTTVVPDGRRVTRVVFLTLLLDILAFTIILPLLPRLIDYYRAQEGQSKDTLLGQLLVLIARFRAWTVVSPAIGQLSDRFGRRTVLLYTLAGNLLSCLLWAFADNFGLFLLARIIGGLSEGNVQLAVAIITDVTQRTTRSRGLAMVGIAFAIGFTVGAATCANIATSDLHRALPASGLWHLNPYAGAALFAALLIVIETVIVFGWLDETAQYRSVDVPAAYTLTFLTHDVHGFTPMQNGKLLGLVGVVSAVVQGGYVRRSAYRIGEKRIVLQGIFWLWTAALLLAFTSATVVNCLTALASMQCDDEAESMRVAKPLVRGMALGHFRSSGQLGRAAGPLLACTIYWLAGPVFCYTSGAVGVLLIALVIYMIGPDRPLSARKQA